MGFASDFLSRHSRLRWNGEDPRDVGGGYPMHEAGLWESRPRRKLSESESLLLQFRFQPLQKHLNPCLRVFIFSLLFCSSLIIT
jgi:hypothetical protein